MAETDNATKRTRDGPKGPVRPEPAPVQIEQDSEARARALVELLRSDGAAAASPPSENGNGRVGGLLSGTQRSPASGNGNGHATRAVQPADLRTLQRLAGNAAVADLMAPAAPGPETTDDTPVQRAAIGPSPPEQMAEQPERKGAERRAAEAVMAWITSAPSPGHEGEEAEADEAAKGETPAGAEGMDGLAATDELVAEGEGTDGAATAAGETEGQVGPQREVEQESAQTLREARTERAQAVTEPEPRTLQLSGPNLGQMLGPSTLAAAGAAGPLGLVVPVAGLVSGAVAGSVAEAGPGPARRGVTQPGAMATPAASSSRTASAGRSSGPAAAVARTPRAAGAGRYPGTTGSRRGAHRGIARPGSVAPAAATGVIGAPRAAPSATVAGGPPLGLAAAPEPAASATPAIGSETGPAAAMALPPAPPPPRASAPSAGPATTPSAVTSSTAAGSQHVAGSAPGALELSPRAPSDPSWPSPVEPSIQSSPEPSRPSAALQSTAGRRAAQATAATPSPSEAPSERGFTEQRPSPGAARSGATAAATGPATGAAGGRVPGRGGGGAGAPRRGGGGGGGGAPPSPKPVPLGDAALEQWRSASSSAIGDTKANELTEAKQSGQKVEQAGQEIDGTRKGEQPDYETDAKEGQPSMPEEPQKDQVLDTGPAEAAVTAVVTAGEQRLRDQTFQSLGSPPAYPGLNPTDYVPRNSEAYKAMKDLEARLAGEGLSESEKVRLTKELEARKKQVQAIAEKAGKGTAEPPPTVVDEGPASLEPPDPAMGDLMGDVIARELGRVGERANEIRDTALAAMKGKSVPAVSAIGEEEAGTVKTELTTELNGIAEAAGVTEEQLKTKVEEQKTAVENEKKAAEGKLQETTAAATKQVQKRSQEESEDISGAKAAVDKEIQEKQEAVKGPPDTEAIEAKRDEFLGKIETVGAQALAGLRSSLGKRESALDSTGGKQKTAAKQAASNQAAAIRRHWEGDEDPNKGMTEARPTVRWGTTRAGAVDTEVSQKKTAAKTESDRLCKAATDQIKQSKNDVRDWAAGQEGRERSWWEKLWDSIVDWGKQAVATNEAWEKQRNADSRDKMAQDFESLTKMKQALAKGNQAEAQKELGSLDAEQQKLANLYLKGGISSIEFVARSTIGRIKSRRAPELSKKIEQRAIAELGWEDLGTLAKQQGNSGFSPGTLGNQIRGAVSGLGTDEAAVYAALGKVTTNVERAALNKFYQATFGTSLEEDVKGDMSGRELDRALALKEGRSADAAAAAMAYAMEGAGTDEETVRSQLRGKSPEEIKAIKEAYRKQTGRELDGDLRDDMEDAELDNALALSSGNEEAADAAELQMAMEGMGTDEKGLQTVYERIREQEEARAKREGLTPAELQANIAERNSKLKKAYNDKYGAETGGLDVALRDELDDADLGVMDALDEGDATKIDAAKANREHESLYADDDELEKIARNQHKQADLDVNLELASEKARMKAMLDSGDVSVEDYKKFSTDWDQRYKDRDKAITDRSRQNMGKLKEAYSEATNGTQTFDQLIAQETQGFSQLEIQDLVAAGGKLSDEKELYYATAGVGTDEDKIKEIFKGKTPKEIEELRKKYKSHLGRDMDDDVLSDLSGRENLDVGHSMKYGDPDTFARQLAEAESPEERKRILENMRTMMNERKSFEETGLVGSIFAAGADPMNSAAQLEQALQRAEDYEASLTAFESLSDEEKAKKKAELDTAKAKFEMNFSAATEAQEQVRKQIDSYTDAAVQAGAAIAAVAVTIVTAGTAGPVIAAAYGAMAAAAATVALKATLKGAAYGWEELGADVAIGAVDAAVSAATAGAGKVIMQAMQKAIAKQMAKLAAREGAEAAVKSGAKAALKAGAKEGAEEATESAAQAWLKEAAEEAIEGALGGAPTAAFEAAISDDTWKSGDPWGAIMGAGAMGGAMGGGMGVGAKAGLDTLGAGYGAIKGKLGGGKADAPNVDADGFKTDADTSTPAAPDMPEVDLELPPQADPGVAAKSAAEGELPPGVTEGDLGLPPGTVEADAKARAEAEGKTDAELDAEARAEAESRQVGGAEGDPELDLDNRPGEVDVDTPPVNRSEPPPMRQPGDANLDDTLVDIPVDMNQPRMDDVGKPLSMNDLETRYGMPADNVIAIDKIARETGVVIDIRPTNKHAAELLKGKNALPKPAQIKAKTLNEIDVMIGLGSDADLGKVFVVPDPSRIRRPDGYGPDMSEELRGAIDKRIKQRLEEYADFKKKLDKMAAGENPLIRIEENGLIVNTGLKPKGGELPFTGDHDLFDIRRADGTKLSLEEYEAIRDQLIEAGVGIEHGSVVGWRTDSPTTFETPEGKKAYEGMMQTHMEGGSEPLVRIGAGDPQAVMWRPALPPAGTRVDPGGVAHIPPKVSPLPEGSVGQLDGPDALDPAANMEFFRNWIRDDPHREVGLLYNSETGQYAVVQGAGTWVNTPHKLGNTRWMEDLLDAENVGEGIWMIVSHSHPVELGGKITPGWAQWPSGADGDFGAIAWQARMVNGPAQGDIEYTTFNAAGEPELRTMKYGFDPFAENPYWISRPEFPGQEYRFQTAEQYQQWYESHYHAPAAEAAEASGAVRPSDVEGTDPAVATTRPGEGDAPDADVTEEIEPPPATSGDTTQEWDADQTQEFDADQTQEFEPPTKRRGSDQSDEVPTAPWDAEQTQEWKVDKTAANDPGQTGVNDPDKTQVYDPDKTQEIELPPTKGQATSLEDAAEPWAEADTEIIDLDELDTIPDLPTLPEDTMPDLPVGRGRGEWETPPGTSAGPSHGPAEPWAEADTEIIDLDELPATSGNPKALPHDQLPLEVEPDADAELRFRGGGADPHQTREYYSRHSREGIERRRSHMPTDEELLSLPAGHVTQLPGASKFDGRLNRERFEQRALLDMDREIALVYNKHTGQYAMVQGERSSVAMESELTAVLAGDTEWQAMGWVILAHTHPRSAAELETSAANRWPSLADWNALALQSHRYPGTQQSEVKFFAKNDRAGTSHRVETTRFIYDPDPHATGAYVVRQPTGRTETFASIEDYLEFVRIELGVSDASVPQKFFGRTRSGVSRTGSAIEEPATANP